MFGPALENGTYKITKVTKVGTDTTYTAKASHILIKWDNETPEGKKAAKEKAQKILKDIRGGASFAAKALEFGSDGTRTRGWRPELVPLRANGKAFSRCSIQC